MAEITAPAAAPSSDTIGVRVWHCLRLAHQPGWLSVRGQM